MMIRKSKQPNPASVDISFPSKDNTTAPLKPKKTTAAKTKTKVKDEPEELWQAIPTPSEQFVWEPKTTLFQKRTPRYYPVDEVLSALEKSILAGKHSEALYWTNEYACMGTQFVTSLMKRCFEIVSDSISLANPNMIAWVWNVLCHWKKEMGPNGEDEVGSDTLELVFNMVSALCSSEKSRITDSVVRAYFVQSPPNPSIPPYEPHVARAQWHAVEVEAGEGTTTDFANTQVPIVSYCQDRASYDPTANDDDDDADGKTVDPYYVQFQLKEGDAPYLQPWANALHWVLTQIATLHADGNQHFDESAFLRLESAALYYAGLIYQCTEVCHARNRKMDSAYIVWEILDQFVTDHVRTVYKALETVFDNEKNGRREKSFLAQAVLMVTRGPLLEIGEPVPKAPFKYNLKKTITRNAEMQIPIPDNALDYTTAEGKRRSAQPCDYLNAVEDILAESAKSMDMSEGFCATADTYQRLAYRLEADREQCKMKEHKKKTMSCIPFFNFNPRDTKETAPGKKVTVNKQAVERFSLTQFNVIPAFMLGDDDAAPVDQPLPWRGQFVPFGAALDLSSSKAHPFEATFTELTPVNSSSKEGLFFAKYVHPNFATTPVFFVPCSSQQSWTQAVVDEMKPLFGVPKLGTHRIYVDHTPTKKERKAPWTADNLDIVQAGTHVVMYPASAFGVKSVKDIPDDLTTLTTKTLLESTEKRAKAPLFTPEKTAVRHQISNIFVFYLAMGVPRGNLETMLLDATNPGLVTPFLELSAFSNQTFVEILSKILSRLRKSMLDKDKDYFMARWFDLYTNVDLESLNAVFARFHAPADLYTPVVIGNLRDIRAQWLLWGKQFRVETDRQKERQRESARKRSEATRLKRESEKKDVAEDDAAEPPAKKKAKAPAAKKKKSSKPRKMTKKRPSSSSKSKKKKRKREPTPEEESSSSDESSSSESSSEEEEKVTPPPKPRTKKRSRKKSSGSKSKKSK